MIRKLKLFTLNLLAGINVGLVVIMLLVGYSDHLHPDSHPWLSCMGMAFPFVLAVNAVFVPLWVFLSWRRLLIPILGFALAYTPINIYIPLHLPQQPPDDALLVVSYNVAGYGGNYKYEQAFDTIFGYVRRLSPDILCTQEDMSSKWLDTQKRYAELFPYNDTVRVSDPSRNKAVNSVGIHTRFPILRKERISYESISNGSVAYFLKVGADTVVVVNNHLESTHLSNRDRRKYEDMLKGGMSRDTVQAETSLLVDKLGEAMAVRARQADALHQWIDAHRQYPLIVCGDFNDTPISYTRHALAQGLTDCFVEAGNGLGLSFNRKGFNFRIDHLLCSGHFTPYRCEIDSKIDVSDHYPLLCWLKRNEKP